jgi:hypothetical protein
MAIASFCSLAEKETCMESLQAFFDAQASRDIFALGRYIEQHIAENWEAVFLQNRDEMIARYAEIGDTVYGIYGTRLFRPVHDEMRLVGLKATPRLPGNFNTSREWGDDETDRQRWMWSKITEANGTPFGTIVTLFFHDHEQIRIPRPFQVIALAETAKNDVVKALSALSPDFKNALEARVEYAQYYKR